MTDSKLDFFNELNRFSDTLTEDDSLMVVSYNEKDGGLILNLAGDPEMLSLIISNNEAVKEDQGSKEVLEDIQKIILNASYSILMNNKKYKKKFIKGLKS